MQIENKQKQYTIMAKYIKYLGLALIIISAAFVVVGSFREWQDMNYLNLTLLAGLIYGIAIYIIASNKDLAENSKADDVEKGEMTKIADADDGATKIQG